MRKTCAYGGVLVIAMLSLGGILRAEEVTKKYADATRLMGMGAKAKYEKKDEIAWGTFAQAYGVLSGIRQQYPYWNSRSVASSMERCAREMDALEVGSIAGDRSLVRSQMKANELLSKASSQADEIGKFVSKSQDILERMGAKKQEDVEVVEKIAPAPGSLDTDYDGLNDAEEARLGTSPTSADTDGDGLGDFKEINTYGTSPIISDTDGDGLSDGFEVLSFGTNPLESDTDGDALSDGEEQRWATDPHNPDTDGDGDSDGEEVSENWDPLIPFGED